VGERDLRHVRDTGFSTSWNCAIGCVLVILSRDSTIAFYGAVSSAVAILALFFGQRMAKDYPGAAVLVPYFLVALLAIYLLARP
jgi:hypothetical protein